MTAKQAAVQQPLLSNCHTNKHVSTATRKRIDNGDVFYARNWGECHVKTGGNTEPPAPGFNIRSVLFSTTYFGPEYLAFFSRTIIIYWKQYYINKCNKKLLP
jgi:hypothetical protein